MLVGQVEPVDRSALDVADYLDRFSTKAIGSKLKQESVVTYSQRFEKAVTANRDYIEHQKLPSIRGAGTRTRAKAGSAQASLVKNGNGHGGQAPEVEVSSLIDYPFPLRSGQVAHLRLPLKLEKADAERLGAFIRTLAFEPMLGLTAPTGEDAA